MEGIVLAGIACVVWAVYQVGRDHGRESLKRELRDFYGLAEPDRR